MYKAILSPLLLKYTVHNGYLHTSIHTICLCMEYACVVLLLLYHQDALFDARVYPNASSCCSASLPSAYRKHEQSKKQEYCECLREIEHGMLTP